LIGCPTTADVARELAGDATWRRLLTDEQGVLLDVGRQTYRPPAALRDFVQAGQDLCVPRLLDVRAPIRHRPHDLVPGRPDRTGESRSDVPSASPPQAGPPLDGVPADPGTVRMDHPEQSNLHPTTSGGLNTFYEEGLFRPESEEPTNRLCF
jgi:hypothetical protein